MYEIEKSFTLSITINCTLQIKVAAKTAGLSYQVTLKNQ